MPRKEQQKIALHTPEGQALLSQTKDTIRQDHLILIFKKQAGNTTCGIHSATLLLNARHVGLTQPNITVSTTAASLDWRNLPYTETNMFTFEETRSVLDHKAVEKHGCGLEQLHNLFTAHGFNTSMHYSNCTTLDTFRSLASKALSYQDSKCGIIVNFDSGSLGQWEHGSGHFSPLAAYSPSKDSFLLLDTWGVSEETWVHTAFLYQTMCSLDDVTGTYRGFIILEE